MHTSEQSSLARVAQLVDRLVDATVALLILRGGSPEQLALALKRERTMRSLQEMMHTEAASKQVDEQQWWQIVGAIVAASVAYTADDTSDPILYKRCPAQSVMLPLWQVRLCSA